MARKITAILLSLLILVMTSGFTISSHYCAGKRVKTVVGVSKEKGGCGMMESVNSCDSGSTMTSNCCKDTFQEVKMVQDYTPTFEKAVEKNPAFALLFACTSYFQSDQKSAHPSEQAYSPPPLIKDIPVFIQSFLI